jgi:RNA polymerase sigma factor (sigma-70 family)
MQVDEETANDLVHEFIVSRAPRAIEAFRPERGELEGWLFVVFRRFVIGALRDGARRRQLVAQLGKELVRSTGEETEFQSDLEALRSSIASLPNEEREAMVALLSSDLASVRDVAATLGISRWRAQQVIQAALFALRNELTSSRPDAHNPPPAAHTVTSNKE